MNATNLWERYCSFYEKPFSEQMEYNKERAKRYVHKWMDTDLAKRLCQGTPQKFRDIPITSYDDYPMLVEFGRKITNATNTFPRKQGELFKDYYERITHRIGPSLNHYMTEPCYVLMKTTGTTGESKWAVHGETFWKNFVSGAVTSAVVACSDKWGETKVQSGDKAFNITAPIPYLSGWALWAVQTQFKLVPPITVTDNLRSMKDAFLFMFKAIEKGEKIALGGGLGSMFYMICKYFVEPEEFFQETYDSMNFGLRKMLVALKLLQLNLSKKGCKKIVDFIPLKGVTIGGLDSRLYIDFFKKEFNLEPLNNYGSTEVGNLMRGTPDRKSDLVPDLKTGFLEFQTDEGHIRGLDELRKGEVYDLVVTPFGSIFFRYDMKDLFRVIDFRDDGMPIFAFEGRKKTIIRLYGYDVTTNIIVQALLKAGLRSSDKWAVIKLFKPKEHLHFLMEKTWPYSESEAEKKIFKSLIETEKTLPYPDETLLRDYIADFRIYKPSEVIKVEYVKPGAFLRYSMIKAREGSPLGQYKPPKIISSDKMDIYETLRKA
jgi:hypothetical protein